MVGPEHTPQATEIAAVVIGRNEGQRLLRCLESLKASGRRIIYVDSGSTDGSAAAAGALGAEVIALDMEMPFTAARARNAGIEALRHGAAAEFIQFVDGDCEIHPDWMPTAERFLKNTPEAAVAYGRLRERFPEASIYNRHCDREWNTPVGQVRSCGGNAMIRMAALDQVKGYNPALIAGEEPEMCVRMRAEGWTIWRIDAEMGWHDAAMTRFSQFWKRARRGGYARAEGAAMHGAAPEFHGLAETRRALFWGAALPAVIVLLALVLGPVFLGLFALYPLQVARLARRGGGNRAAWEYAALLTVGKFAEAMGVIEYHWRRKFGRPSGLIEYK